MPTNPDKRTVAEVIEARKNAIGGGCCERFGNQQGCDCLADARTRELNAYPKPRPKFAVAVDGPFPAVHPRHGIVTKAENEYGAWVTAWAERHNLTLSEMLSIIAREQTRTLESCVRSERKGKT